MTFVDDPTPRRYRYRTESARAYCVHHHVWIDHAATSRSASSAVNRRMTPSPSYPCSPGGWCLSCVRQQTYPHLATFASYPIKIAVEVMRIGRQHRDVPEAPVI